MSKYQNKYRVASARAQWWDYGWNGAYFITICTQNREHFFGKIIEARLIASQPGQLAEKFWHEIPNQFPYAKLGDFVVMPDHIHGILILDKPTGGNDNGHNDDHVAQTRLIASVSSPSPSKKSSKKTKNTGGFAGEKNPMINKNISRIIRWYKGRCTYEIRKTHTDFAWQPRFHDHIIRNETEYYRISDYIINNPSNWKNRRD